MAAVALKTNVMNSARPPQTDSLSLYTGKRRNFENEVALAILRREVMLGRRSEIESIVGTRDYADMANMVIRDDVWIGNVLKDVESMLAQIKRMKGEGNGKGRIPFSEKGLYFASFAVDPPISILGAIENREMQPDGSIIHTESETAEKLLLAENNDEEEGDTQVYYSDITSALEGAATQYGSKENASVHHRKTIEAPSVSGGQSSTEYRIVNPQALSRRMAIRKQKRIELSQSLQGALSEIRQWIITNHMMIANGLDEAIVHLSLLEVSLLDLKDFYELLTATVESGIISPAAARSGVLKFPVIDGKINQFQLICNRIETIYHQLHKRMLLVNQPNVLAAYGLLTGQSRLQIEMAIRKLTK